MKNPDTLHDSYKIADNSELLLTVVIGEAQLGNSATWKNEVYLDEGPYTRRNRGKGAEWNGKELRIKTVVTDKNSFTNKMDVTYKLEGGAAAYEKTVRFTVDNDGDSAVFRAIFKISN